VGTSSIENAGNGWYRCTIKLSNAIANSTHGVLILPQQTNNPTTTYAGNGTSGILAWGAQLVEGTDAKPYFATTNRLDVPRLHYRNADGTVSTCPRLLLEPQRTNSIRNSTMVGAVAGSPGTAPTNWSIGTGGLTQTVVGFGTESGLQYIDIRLNGTATSGISQIAFEGLNNIAAVAAQSWANSLYCKRISGTYDQAILMWDEWTAALGFNASKTQNITLTTQLARYTQVNTISTSSAFVQPKLRFAITNGATYDFTIRIAAPQMELGAYATTFIPTTTAAVTRLVDTPILNNGAFLPTAYPFTLFAEIDIVDTASGYPFSFINSATSNNYFSIEYVGNTWYAVSRPNATSVFASGSFTTTRGRHKVAALFTTSTIKLYVDGTPVATASNTNAFNSAINDLCVGLLRTVTDNGARTSIFQSAVLNRELTNAELAQITTL